MPFDGTELAVKAGDKRTLNLVLLGASLQFLPIQESFILDAIKNTVPKKVIDINQKAFAAGRAQAAK